jgi:hypothetical protein
MESPKCKLCGTRHYGICVSAIDQPASALPALPDEQAMVHPPAPVPVQALPMPVEVHPKQDRRAYMREYVRARRQAQKDAAPPPKPPFDYNAYQREYMRRRRAMQKPA